MIFTVKNALVHRVKERIPTLIDVNAHKTTVLMTKTNVTVILNYTDWNDYFLLQ